MTHRGSLRLNFYEPATALSKMAYVYPVRSPRKQNKTKIEPVANRDRVLSSISICIISEAQI